MAKPELRIIIVTYNAMPWIDFCFSAFAEPPEGWRVIAVDNGSGDGTVRTLRDRYPHVTVIESGENLGFGRANNLGLAMALKEEAEHVFLLNQDASASVAGITTLMDIQRRHPEYLVLSPVHLNGKGTDLDWRFSNCCTPYICPGLLVDALRGALGELYATRRVNAAAWLLSARALREIGGFNPCFYHYGEDDEYIHRVLFHGYKIGIAPNVHIRHGRKQNIRSKPPDHRFVRTLAAYLDPAENGVHLGRVLWHGLSAVVASACQGRKLVSRHYRAVLGRMLKSRLSGADIRAATREKGHTFL